MRNFITIATLACVMSICQVASAQFGTLAHANVVKNAAQAHYNELVAFNNRWQEGWNGRS